MLGMLRNRIPRSPRSLGAITLLLLVGIVIACLWPFRAPKNTASWLTDGNGIVFGRFGVILGSTPLTLPGDPEAASVSIEFWLQPDATRDMGEILAVYSAENPRQLAINQWHTGMVIRSAAIGDRFRTFGARCFTPNVFRPGKSVFVTITSTAGETDVYLDGNLSKRTPTFRITNAVASGKLVVGTAATTDDDWRGQLRGLAIYKRPLDPEQVRNHYTNWTGNGRPDIRNSDGLLALYLFGERTGRSVRNEVAGGGDLYVPERYFIPAKDVLSPPTLDDWADIISNIFGFMPLGFVLCGYLISARRTRWAIFVTTIVCGSLSLGLETLQTFLPTRDSSMMDVITNLLGGTIGALLYRCATQDRASAPRG
jgi:VanZ family protein